MTAAKKKKTRRSSIGIDRAVHRRTQEDRNELAAEFVSIAVDALQGAKSVMTRNYGPAKKNLAAVKRGTSKIKL